MWCFPPAQVKVSVPETPPAVGAPRFETPVTRWQVVYGWLASGLVLALVIELLRVAPDLSWPARTAFTAMIVLNTAFLSRIFEGRAGAIQLEATRSLLMLAPLAAGLWFYPVPLAVRGAALVSLLASLGILFLLQRDSSPSKPIRHMDAT